MAKKPKSAKKIKINIFKDERFKTISGLFVLFLSAFALLAFVSYLFTWQTDQSFTWQRVFSGSDITVENWAGKAGAWLGNIFLNKWFGLPAFVVPYLLFIVGLRLLDVRLVPLRKTTRTLLIGMILFSIILGFVTGSFYGFLGSGAGGAHGYMMSEWMVAFIGKTGTAFFLIIMAFAYVVFSFHGVWLWLQNRIKGEMNSSIIPNNGKKEVHDNETFEKEFDFKEAITTEVNGDEVNLIFENSDLLKNGSSSPRGPVKKEVVSDGEIELTIEKSKAKEEELTDFKRGNLNTPYDPTLSLSQYVLPSIELLDEHKSGKTDVTNEELINNKNKIVETLANYKIQIDKIKATVGPAVTLYEIVPAPGIRISKIKSLEDDIALSLAALGIRIIAPIPGRGTIGIEVPNQHPEIVSMRSILSSKKFQECNFELAVALGKTISNETYVFDLAKMPHLLVAGATGQGKSVGLNAIITSLLYKKHPSELKFVLIDPKKVELTLYSKLEQHFLARIPDNDEAIITDTHKVIYTLNSLTKEMDMRYDLLKLAQVRNIREYNERFRDRKLNPENGHRFLPYIVIVIDEFADLIMTAGKEIETPIARLAQLARAIGIHLIIATQRPTTNIITGVIKANFPARIAFRVSSMIDSRTILDSPGANQLVGRGDMLISNGNDLTRIQCAFIDIPEIERITNHVCMQPGVPEQYLLPVFDEESSNAIKEIDLDKRDEFFTDAARLVVINQQGSTSLIQRKLSIGYNRAGRIVDQLEAAGIVGPPDGSKARDVLITDLSHLEQILMRIP